ncbi:hypothetical protein AB1Y20_011818 [Prymnesium parvum]|uniref:Uncharacterized protein n=1 Tax=Prymnesium parvum TaxID=97485 RepID=A0AB34IJJ1_PRYPA
MVRQRVTNHQGADACAPTSPTPAADTARDTIAPAQPMCRAEARAHGANSLHAGATALVARECWPNEPCAENGGAGWTVTVLSVTRHTAVIQFLHARAPSGAPYAPIRVQLQMLRTPA